MQQLKSIQALRGIAALAVAAYHLVSIEQSIWKRPDRFTNLAEFGVFGVDLFFVLSGFVMVWVAAETPRGTASARSFLIARAVRIYPLWWIYAGLAALGYWGIYGVPWDPERVMHFELSGSGHLIRSFALWPQAAHPVLSPGWSLVHEMYFYMAFALLILCVPVTWRIRALLFWGAAILANAHFGNPLGHSNQFSSLIFHPYTLYFLFGVFTAYAIRAGWRSGIWLALTVSGGVVLGVIGPFEDALVRGILAPEAVSKIGLELRPWPRTILLGCAFACLTYGLVAMETGRKVRLVIPSWLVTIGNWSYSLYLCHLLTISVAGYAVNAVLPPDPAITIGIFVVAATSLTLVVSYLSYTWIERPIIAAFKRRRSTTEASSS